MGKKVKSYRLISSLLILAVFFLIMPSKPNDLVEAAIPTAALSSSQVFAYSVEPQAMVSITFDDASATVYDVGYPILSAHNIPATFYFISSSLDSTWTGRLNDLQDHGWEIGSHSRTHTDLSLLNDADLIRELSQSKAELETAGLDVSGFAYPGGQGHIDGNVVRKVKQYYSYARSVASGENSPIIRQFDLHCRVQTSATTWETMKGWVDSAIENHQWLIIDMHSVDDSGDIYSITSEALDRLVDYIVLKAAQNQILAVTMQNGADLYDMAGWAPIHDPQEPVPGTLVITNGRILWWLGNEAIDYLYDGYEWIESGELSYNENHGNYHYASHISDITLSSLRPDYVSARFTLTDDTDGDYHVTNTVSLYPDSLFSTIAVTDIQGTAVSLSIDKWINRRFSLYQGEAVTDGLLEIGTRNYGINGRVFYYFDIQADLIKMMIQPREKILSEYSSYTKGQMRARAISRENELPYTWFTGGIRFDTQHLLYEAEHEATACPESFYFGEDASPKIGATGIVLDECNSWVSFSIAPPYAGDYTLAIRHKGNASSDRYSYQIDEGGMTTREVTGTAFGYEYIPLADLSAQSHTITVGLVSGKVSLDYVLLTPTHRSSNSPSDVDFPLDMLQRIFRFSYLPLLFR